MWHKELTPYLMTAGVAAAIGTFALKFLDSVLAKPEDRAAVLKRVWVWLWQSAIVAAFTVYCLQSVREIAQQEADKAMQNHRHVPAVSRESELTADP